MKINWWFWGWLGFALVAALLGGLFWYVSSAVLIMLWVVTSREEQKP